jgi:nucleotide-binding universal stress UspA family protein
LIAWNASAPASRAVHDAMPFLRRAEETTLLYVDDAHDRARARHLVSAIVDHLARHQVEVRAHVMTAADASPAHAILDRIDELGVNLLVMGAFSRSRLREIWFGGASEELLHQVGVPILTCH